MPTCACGLSVVMPWQGETISFPRVNASCDYVKPARFEDRLTIEVRVERLGRSSVRYGFTFRRDEEVLATGALTAVLCRVIEGHRLEAMAIPDELRTASSAARRAERRANAYF